MRRVGGEPRRALQFFLLGNKRGFDVFYPEPELCTDNGAMIALAAAQRLDSSIAGDEHSFSVKPRWEL